MCQTHNKKDVDIETVRRFLDELNARNARSTRNSQLRKRDIQKYLAYFAEQSQLHARGLKEGRFNIDTWLDTMSKELYQLHFTMYGIGRGGVDDLTSEDLAYIRRKHNEQLAYLRAWAQQMRTTSELPSESYIASRAKLYAGAGNTTVQQAKQIALGVPLLPFNPGDGTSTCRTNCHCEWKWRQLDGEGNWNFYWVMGKAEHCDECQLRARVAAPLRIRGGILMDQTKYENPALYRF